MYRVEMYARVRRACRVEGMSKHLVPCRIERRPPRLDLDVYPYLPKARVATTSARSYMSLLPGAGT